MRFPYHWIISINGKTGQLKLATHGLQPYPQVVNYTYGGPILVRLLEFWCEMVKTSSDTTISMVSRFCLPTHRWLKKTANMNRIRVGTSIGIGVYIQYLYPLGIHIHPIGNHNAITSQQVNIELLKWRQFINATIQITSLPFNPSHVLFVWTSVQS